MDQAIGRSGPRGPSVARTAQQEDLLRKLNQALRQSVSAPPPPGSVGPAPARPETTPPPATPIDQPSQPSPPRAQPPKPLVFGRGAPQTEDGDLWHIVDPGSAAAPSSNSDSFEEALRRVDSSLEALVGQDRARPRGGELPVEATIEGEEDPRAGRPYTGLEDDDLGDPNDIEAAKARRQRLLKRAMENLGAMPPRATPSGAQAVEQPHADLPPVATPPPVSGSPPTPAEKQLADQIELRYLEAKKKDYFSILGVAKSANKEQVKAAYLSLAKIFHPDRLPPSLPTLASKMSAVFESIREAYETLYDDQRRHDHIKAGMQAAGGATAAPADAGATASNKESTDLMRTAEVFFKKRDYRQAEQHFARAFAADKNANALAAQGWAIYMDPARKAEAAAAKDLMEKALKHDPKCDRAHYQLGVIARVEGDLEGAERHFRAAVRINPKHLEANQELRLIEMRKKKGGGAKKGFFG